MGKSISTLSTLLIESISTLSTSFIESISTPSTSLIESISTPSTSPLESIPKDLLRLLATFLGKESHKALVLALMNEDLLAFYKHRLQRVDSILLWVPPSKRLHPAEPEAVYLDVIKSSLKYRRIGWGCTEITTIKSTSDTCEYPSVDAIHLTEPFELPVWILKYAVRIRYISLRFFKNTTKDLSFLRKFTNLKTLCLLGVQFNDNMVAMIVPIISGLQSLFSLLLHGCTIDNYLSKITTACKVTIFVLSQCFSSGEIMPPSQCRQLLFRPIDNIGLLDLSDCSDLYKL
jgi:hypothetical protein